MMVGRYKSGIVDEGSTSGPPSKGFNPPQSANTLQGKSVWSEFRGYDSSYVEVSRDPKGNGATSKGSVYPPEEARAHPCLVSIPSISTIDVNSIPLTVSTAYYYDANITNTIYQGSSLYYSPPVHTAPVHSPSGNNYIVEGVPRGVHNGFVASPPGYGIVAPPELTPGRGIAVNVNPAFDQAVVQAEARLAEAKRMEAAIVARRKEQEEREAANQALRDHVARVDLAARAKYAVSDEERKAMELRQERQRERDLACQRMVAAVQARIRESQVLHLRDFAAPADPRPKPMLPLEPVEEAARQEERRALLDAEARRKGRDNAAVKRVEEDGKEGKKEDGTLSGEDDEGLLSPLPQGWLDPAEFGLGGEPFDYAAMAGKLPPLPNAGLRKRRRPQQDHRPCAEEVLDVLATGVEDNNSSFVDVYQKHHLRTKKTLEENPVPLDADTEVIQDVNKLSDCFEDRDAEILKEITIIEVVNEGVNKDLIKDPKTKTSISKDSSVQKKNPVQNKNPVHNTKKNGKTEKNHEPNGKKHEQDKQAPAKVAEKSQFQDLDPNDESTLPSYMWPLSIEERIREIAKMTERQRKAEKSVKTTMTKKSKEEVEAEKARWEAEWKKSVRALKEDKKDAEKAARVGSYLASTDRSRPNMSQIPGWEHLYDGRWDHCMEVNPDYDPRNPDKEYRWRILPEMKEYTKMEMRDGSTMFSDFNQFMVKCLLCKNSKQSQWTEFKRVHYDHEKHMKQVDTREQSMAALKLLKDVRREGRKALAKAALEKTFDRNRIHKGETFYYKSTSDESTSGQVTSDESGVKNVELLDFATPIKSKPYIVIAREYENCCQTPFLVCLLCRHPKNIHASRVEIPLNSIANREFLGPYFWQHYDGKVHQKEERKYQNDYWYKQKVDDVKEKHIFDDPDFYHAFKEPDYVSDDETGGQRKLEKINQSFHPTAEQAGNRGSSNLESDTLELPQSSESSFNPEKVIQKAAGIKPQPSSNNAVYVGDYNHVQATVAGNYSAWSSGAHGNGIALIASANVPVPPMSSLDFQFHDSESESD